MHGLLKNILKSQTFSEISNFAFSASLMSFANMLAGVLIIRWLNPEQLGLWNSIYIALYYISFLQLGMFNSLNREMPFYLGKNKSEFAISLVSTTQWHARLLIILIFISTIILVCISWIFKLFTKIEIFSIANLGIIIAFQLGINFLTVTYRANKSFRKLAFINRIQSLVILLSLVLVFCYNYYGYVIRFVIMAITLFAMMYVWRPYKVESKFNLSNYKLLLKTGIPLFTLVFMLNITDTFNRLILLKVADVTAVGYYYPAIAIIVAMKILPASVSQFLYPKMSFEVGRSNDLEKIWGWIKKTLIALFLIMTPVAIIGYFILPYIFDHFFQEYKPSLFASRIALFSGLLSGSYIIVTVFSSLKSWKELVWLACLKVILYSVLQYYFANKMTPIDGVAVGTILADAIFFIVLVFLTKYVLIIKHKI